jgi:protein-tyrosine kinase
MSRIDEALSRARNIKPEDLMPEPPPSATGAEFPSELDSGAPAQFTDAPDEATSAAPVDAAAANAAGSEPLVETTTLEQDEFRQLPLQEKLATGAADSAAREQYRRLAGRLYLSQAEKGTRLVMVTSALAGEGKTLTATNLALTLAESYKRQVLLIDADLRRPSVHQMFNLPNLTGLNDGLRFEDSKIPLLRLSDNLTVLTAGRPDSDPMSVLSSERMRRVLHEASARFDWVIVDTPPVALLTDAHLLAALVDAVILVIQAGRTPLSAINTAMKGVGRERIMGVVLNRAEDALPFHAYSYYGYHNYVSTDKADR